jgi:putative mRNA 3-end processing factor
MEIVMHGAANEVGRSCVQLKTKHENVLFDCGIKLTSDLSEYPTVAEPKKVNAVFLSHAHLDHSGALPLFNYNGLNCPIFTNIMTKELSKVLMKDSLHVELLREQNPAYSKDNIYNVMDLMVNAQYNKPQAFNSMNFTFHDAGHIPGSASIMVEAEGKKIVYTGDFNLADSKLLKGGKSNFGKLDVLVTESTYGNREHPPREKEIQHFLSTVQQTIDNGSSVLIPAFAVGRSQEVLLMLQKLKTHVPIYLDGMSKEVIKLFFTRPQFITNSGNLKKAVEKVKFLTKPEQRKEATEKQGIFVTTSGMLDGGPILDYLKHYYAEKDAALLLTGFQTEGTNGHLLLKEGNVFLDGNKVKVKCRVEKYDFSAHAGQSHLKTVINNSHPKHLILNHGDPESIIALAKWAEETYKDIQVYKPKVDDVIKV